MKLKIIAFLLITLSMLGQSRAAESEDKPRLSLFIGVDVSGSFLKGKYFDDSLHFLANYIYSHLHGLGGLDVPRVLFVGSLGGVKTNEPKTLYPIQTFENKTVHEIHDKLNEIFPKKHEDPYTDFNAFFKQVEATVKNKSLILRPISVVLISDGIPDFPGSAETHDVSKIDIKPLELLSRNVTIRLLYTNAVVGAAWQNKVKRQRVKVWTQDAEVMTSWKDSKIFNPTIAIGTQTKFFSWVKDNVDFPVRLKRVD